MKYKVIAGQYSHNGKLYNVGDVVKSEKDLEKKFPNMFRQIADEVLVTIPAKINEKQTKEVKEFEVEAAPAPVIEEPVTPVNVEETSTEIVIKPMDEVEKSAKVLCKGITYGEFQKMEPIEANRKILWGMADIILKDKRVPGHIGLGKLKDKMSEVIEETLSNNKKK